MHPDFFYLNTFLFDTVLPQEWIVGPSHLTTCKGDVTFIRIENELTQGSRKLICLIQVTENEITIISPDVLSYEVSRVIQAVKTCFDRHIIALRCLTITECPLCCESCAGARIFYQESASSQKQKPFSAYEEFLISP